VVDLELFLGHKAIRTLKSCSAHLTLICISANQFLVDHISSKPLFPPEELWSPPPIPDCSAIIFRRSDCLGCYFRRRCLM